MQNEKLDANQSLIRGLRLIEFLADYANGCSLAHIAQQTGINKSTSYRLLKSLQGFGYVTQTEKPGFYRLTAKLVTVGGKNFERLDIINVAAPHLEQLNIQCGHTVNLSALDGNRVILIHKLEPTTGGMRTRAYIGEHTPLYCEAPGKVFLAFADDGYLDRYWEAENHTFVKHTSHTIMVKNVMEHELMRVRAEYVAYDREEGEIGAFCVASPIFNKDGRVEYVLSISVSLSNLDEQEKMTLADTACRYAQRITRDFCSFQTASESVPQPVQTTRREMSSTSGKSTDSSQSLGRGLMLIEYLSDFPEGRPLAKIAEETGLNKSTAHRLLKSLQTQGYVRATGRAGNYLLGSKFMAIGYKALSSLNIIAVAAPHLEKLNLETSETVIFSAREGSQGIIIYKLEPTAGLLRTRSYIGQRVKLHCTCMGKIFLAFTPDAYLEKYWKEEKTSIIKQTLNTITDIDLMRHELARIRVELLSYDREESELGIGCIAAPVFSLNRRVDYAVSISAPVSRLGEKRKVELSQAVLATAKAVSQELGGEAF